jgi:NAD(P)-dependent dehydrogenase (short-subunit alcohol dehydrogenase family)
LRYPLVGAKTVLITGCSSGIGLASARYLQARGWLVLPTARSSEDLEALRSGGFDPISLDLVDARSVAEAARMALEHGGGRLGGLVNNAGYAQFGAVEDLSREALRRQFETNVLGMQELTNLLIPAFRAQGFGRIVNVSSVYGRISAPLVGAYCASKYAMEALSDAMRIELRGSGVALSIIEPGPIVTEFRRNAASQSAEHLDMEGGGRFGRRYAKSFRRAQETGDKPKPFSAPPEAVARRILHALTSKRPRRRYRVTLPAYVVAVMRRVAPDALLDALLAKSARP